MLTPGYSLTATERVLPSLALDFTTAVLDPRVTVTRALNTATRINSSGLIEVVNANLPRFDYTLNTGGACKGLLIEATSANYMKDWSDYSSAQWAKTSTGSASIPANTGNTTTAPNGATAQIWSFTATGSDRSILSQTAAGSSGNWSASIFLKAGRAEDIGKIVTVKETQGASYALYTLTDQWQRAQSIATSANTTRGLAIELRPGVGTSSGTVQAALWGAQAEPGDFVSSAIPNTTAGTVTRNADMVTQLVSTFNYNASEGALVAEGARYGTNTGFIADISDNTFNNFALLMNLAGTSTGQFAVGSGGVSQAAINVTNSFVAGDGRMAGGYKLNNFQAAGRGALGTADTSGVVPVGSTTLNIGRYGSSELYHWNGWVRRVQYYPQRLLNAELQAFSKM